jgi:hypothetical protein
MVWVQVYWLQMRGQTISDLENQCEVEHQATSEPAGLKRLVCTGKLIKRSQL